jgi:alpha-D-ribose 1-methylphosphonate 5-triphosphate diphosphatase
MLASTHRHGGAAASSLFVTGGTVLIDGRFTAATVAIADDGCIAGTECDVGGRGVAGPTLDATGLLVLPGVVDIHGDAFERQVMPRPGVDFPLDVALHESDRQAVANGITTVFHGVTWSWEPGLRGAENARRLLVAVEVLRPALGADTRLHLRHETFNIDAEDEIRDWLAAGRIGVLAFNDHMTLTATAVGKPRSFARMVERTGLSHEDFMRLVDRVLARRDEVPGSIERLAGAAVACGVPLLSHDDTSPDMRTWYRSLGCRVAEFPTTLEAAENAAAHGDDIVFGAPNVVRGGSHTGWTCATDMIRRGLCSVLASDYYYPAPLLAAFRLDTSGTLPFAAAWSLVAEAPARAIGFSDRGRIAAGCRGDLVLVDRGTKRPRIVATVVAGRIVHLADAGRIHHTGLPILARQTGDRA